ncbi:GntR family transcriptional regulator [Saccharopolyspora shandongensis]|uniref:FadR/GntR family transcriptional regulator n=1 Tax=Saccharopolyspora shandongensis TaxID=418495 RepID=UPI00342EBDCD
MSSQNEPLVLHSRASEALFRAVRTGNAFEETVERLLQAIRLGVVAPGERLPAERELAARLNVSRVTLREAIRALQESGYVESRRGRYGGTFVNVEPPRPSRKGPRRIAREMGVDLHDALTHRHVLEVGAAEQAAARDLGEAERAHLVSRLSDAGTAELHNYRRMDSRLHLAIAELSGSASLTSAVADVRMRLNELLDSIPLLERNIVHSNEQHEEVVRAILDGDQGAARRAMAEHLEGTASLLRGFLS